MHADVASWFVQCLICFFIAYGVARVTASRLDCMKAAYWSDSIKIVSAFPEKSDLHFDERKELARVFSKALEQPNSKVSEFTEALRIARSGALVVEKFTNTERAVATGVVLSLVYTLVAYAVSLSNPEFVEPLTLFDVKTWGKIIGVWGILTTIVVFFPNLRRQELLDDYCKIFEAVINTHEFRPVRKITCRFTSGADS